MRLLRGLGGALLWVVASVVALLAVVLCVTIILLPVGIPLFMLAKKMFGRAVGLMLPRTLTHPVDEGGKKASKRRKDASKKAGKASKRGRKKSGKLADKGGKKINEADKVGKRGDKKIAELAKKGDKKARELVGAKKKSRLPWRK
jgi:hypothetical protein